MNILVHVSFWTNCFSGYMPRSRISGSHGSSIFSILRNLHTVVYSGCTSLHSHWQCRRVPFSLQPLWHVLLVDFLNDGHSNWCEEILLLVLICVSLIINHVEHLFMSWPSVCLIWRNIPLGLLSIFWLGWLFVLIIEPLELFVNFWD